MATAKKYATIEDVAQLTAKVDDVITALASLAAAQAGGEHPKAKTPKAPTKAPKVDGLQVKLIGNPDRVYIERAWVWAEWDTKPTPSTLKRLKAAGWRYSSKRRAWHKVHGGE